MDEKHLKRAYETLAKLKKRADQDGTFGTASFAGIFPKKAAEVFFQGPCHGSLVSISKGSVAIISLVRIGDCTNRQVEIFYDWLFNESPWQDIFVIKNPKEVLKLGGVICRTNFPSNLIAGGLFATRGPWNQPNTVKFFVDLTTEDKKLNKNLVLISSMWCRLTHMGNSNKRRYVIAQSCSGHWPLGSDHSEKYILNFVNNRPSKLRKNFCDSSEYRTGRGQHVYPIWGDHRCGQQGKPYKLLLKDLFSKKRGTKITIKDMWGEKHEYVGCIDRKDFVANMARVLREVQKGLKIAV